MNISTDVLIVGTGASALYCALNLREDINILMVTKGTLTECNSYLAQGGISVALDKNDVSTFVEDTMKAGNYKNNKRFVEILCNESIENINTLVELGIPFNKINDDLCRTKEGAHSRSRIVHCNDNTGKYLVDTLLNIAKKKKNITLLEYAHAIDLIIADKVCNGAVIIQDKKQLNVLCKTVILATGGIGGLFKNSTNERSITGDGLFMALKHNIELKDLSYIQFHPTALYKENYNSKRFLISESVRGEGGKLYNFKGKTFIDELLPRDIVSKGIQNEIELSGVPYVYLDISHLPSDYIKNRFPSIYKECLLQGIDITKTPIPVSPAQHYFMGGVKVNEFSESSMKNLYAIGEASCTGAHGNNRLASNSLLEGLVFSKRAANNINSKIEDITIDPIKVQTLYSSLENIEAFQRKTVIQELKRRCPLLNDELFSYRQHNIKCSSRGYTVV